jgi:hypothetical protein
MSEQIEVDICHLVLKMDVAPDHHVPSVNSTTLSNAI